MHRENTPLGTRTEVKNIGSVRAVAQAIEYEIARQIDVLDGGGRIFNETRAWDAVERKTIAMRDKEVVQDYRFMPEPNLPPLHVHVEGDYCEGDDVVSAVKIRTDLPELPEETRKSIVETHHLTPEMAIILVVSSGQTYKRTDSNPTSLQNDITLHSHFRSILDEPGKTRSPKVVANFLINELLTILNKNKVDLEECHIPSSHLAEIVDMLETNRINQYLARLILQEALEQGASGQSPSQIAADRDWLMITDEAKIEQLCRDVIQRNPKVVEKYRSGKDKMLYALAGDIAKLTEQKADMARTVELLKRLLKK